jgi:hypothetical protein
MPIDRGIPSLLLIYVGVIGMLFVGAGLGFMKIVNSSTGITQRASLEQTLLDQRVNNARDIRKALKKPLPSPEPLPAITASVQHASSSPSNSGGRTVLNRSAGMPNQATLSRE